MAYIQVSTLIRLTFVREWAFEFGAVVFNFQGRKTLFETIRSVSLESLTNILQTEILSLYHTLQRGALAIPRSVS